MWYFRFNICFVEKFHVVFLYSHLVWATKFLMIRNDYHVEGNDLVYELPNDATIGLWSTLVALEDD
jgi:hypothetical protein